MTPGRDARALAIVLGSMVDHGSSGKTQTARLWAYARDERPWGGEAPAAAS